MNIKHEQYSERCTYTQYGAIRTRDVKRGGQHDAAVYIGFAMIVIAVVALFILTGGVL